MSPDDRDVISPEYYLAALMNFPMALPGTSVRILGKTPGYDDSFQQVLDEAGSAVEQNLLQVTGAGSKPQTMPLMRTSDGVLTIGGSEGVGPNAVFAGSRKGVESQLLYQTYRRATTDPALVAAISRGMDDFLVGSNGIRDELAPVGMDDFPLAVTYAPPPLPYPRGVQSDEARAVLNRLCQARVGSAVKSLAACDTNRLAPLTSDPGMAAFIAQLNANVATVDLDGVDERLLHLIGMRELHDLVIAEYVDEAQLRELSIADVVRKRTAAWGKARESRAELGRVVLRLVREERDVPKLRERIRVALAEHRSARNAYDHEQKKLITNIGMTLGTAVLGSSGAVLLERMWALGTTGTVLAIGAFGVNWLRQNALQVMDVLNARENVQEVTGYSLIQPYEPFMA